MRRISGLIALAVAVPLAASAAVLRYQFTVGQELRYREGIAAQGALELKSILGEQTIPIEIEGEELRSLKVVEVAGPGQFWMESRSLESKAKVTVQGKTQQQSPPGQNYKMKVNDQGDVLAMEQLEASQRGPVELDLRLDGMMAAARLTGFPEGDILVGAEWNKEVPIRGRDGKTYTAKVSSRLAKVEEAGGEATIVSRYEVPIPPSDGTIQMGGLTIPVRVRGQSTGESTATWDMARGRATRIAGKGKVEVELTLLGLAPEPAIGRFDVTMDSRLAAK